MFSHSGASPVKEARPAMTPPSCLPIVVAMTIRHSAPVPRETEKRKRENEKTERRDIKCRGNEGVNEI